MSGGGAKKLDETEEQRAIAEIAAERFNRYKEVFAPLEDQYIKQVFDVRDQGNYETAGGLAAAEFQREFQNANQQAAGQMMSQGVDPTSGVFQENSAALRRAQAVKQGLGIAGAKIANTDRFYQGLKGVIQMGQGQASDAIGGLSRIAETAQQKANADAESAFQSNSALRSGSMGVAGYAASPYVDKALGRGASGNTYNIYGSGSAPNDSKEG